MIICFECQAETKKRLDELVVSGGYADFADVIAAAVRNQALLHSKVGEQGTLVIADAIEKSGSSRIAGSGSSRAARPRATREGAASESPGTVGASASVGGNDRHLRVPDLFLLNGL